MHLPLSIASSGVQFQLLLRSFFPFLQELEAISEIAESFGLDDNQKQLLIDHLCDFSEHTKKISHVYAERYEAAKTLKISDKNKDITSLDELTALTQYMSLEDSGCRRT